MCELLTNPANGQVAFDERFVGAVANYSCDAGFNLIGSETRVCQSSSLGWSGDVPFCQSKGSKTFFFLEFLIVVYYAVCHIEGPKFKVPAYTNVCICYNCSFRHEIPNNHPLILVFSTGTQVGFDPIFYNVSESDGVAVLIIRRFTPSSLPVTVLFSTQDGTATGMLALYENQLINTIRYRETPLVKRHR